MLGQIELKGQQKNEVKAALENGIARSDGTMAKCFIPRHAVRIVEQDKTRDYVICFECTQLELHADGERKIVPITRDPERLFNRILKGAGIPLAP